VYWILLLGLLGVSAWIGRAGFASGNRTRVALAGFIAAATLGFFAFLSFWSEAIWFDALGYAPVFWRRVAAMATTAALGAVVGGVGVLLVRGPVATEWRWHSRLFVIGSAVVGALIGFASWDEALLFFSRVTADTAEPIFGRDAGFYLFVLPILDRLLALFLIVTLIALAWPAGMWLFDTRSTASTAGDSNLVGPLRRPLVVLAVVGALWLVLSRYHLLYSEWGVVAGPGWTDVHIRNPAYWVAAVATLLLGVAPAVSERVRAWRGSIRLFGTTVELGGLRGTWLAIAATWLVALVVAPGLVQYLVVEPNEITFEKPYIAHNIAFTRQGFRLHDVEERQFPASPELSYETVRRNQDLLSEARLWDPRALESVYRQFQEIRLYYAFHDVDIDRYTIGGRYRQVMVSARELEQENLPEQSQTFVNRRFKYTHGYGLTLAAVRDFTSDGRPNLLVKDIPPRSEAEELQVTSPQIYYGELTGDPVVVNSREPEFDYPSGDENVSTLYAGRGGVELRNLWRKFLLGWRFDGTQFLFSAYMTPDTRVMFHRRVQSRVAALAPFLELDEDPYVVLVDGKLYWIVDGYTTSDYYPYSEPFLGRRQNPADDVVSRIRGANYVRNSVKAVVDAYDGTTTLYVFDPGDPLVQAWQRAFPTLFRPADAMPPGLRAHVRYPDGFLLAQGLVYAKYHMADPEVFYNQEDLWVRATEKYYARVQPLDPYYVMWQLPGSASAEFVLILPFTPKNRQVMIGWIAGLCDGDNYGRFLAYKFPKERRVLGPQQVETKIDQDRFLSGQLTLWDQRGSAVIRGNVLAIPLDDTLIYVEPIYLQAETAAYPELRLVVMMHGDRLSYGETFEEALEGLLNGARGAAAVSAAGSPVSLAERARRANRAFERYLQLQGEGHFVGAGQALEELRLLLRELATAEAP
jgi:uncharacterized membrane protein (UPF0182 family)